VFDNKWRNADLITFYYFKSAKFTEYVVLTKFPVWLRNYEMVVEITNYSLEITKVET
jgi:hypothetical protein